MLPDDTVNPPSGGEGDDTSDPASGGTRGKLRDIANTAIQSAADRNIEFLKQGRFDDMDPKMRELALVALDQIQSPTSTQRRESTDEVPDEVKRYAEIGKQATAAQALAKIETQVRDRVLQENWVSDAKELFAEFGDREIDLKDWKPVDPTDRKLFPLNETGYRAWRAAANKFRAQMYAPPSAEADETAVEADRAAAQGRGKTPSPKSTAGQVPNTPLARAKALLEGKLDRKEYAESIRSNLNH